MISRKSKTWARLTDASLQPARAALVIIHYGSVELVVNLLGSLKNHPDRLIFSEVIVINNGQSAELPTLRAALSDFAEWVQIVNGPATGFAAGVNKGVNLSPSDIIVMSNNDILWMPQASIYPLVRHLANHPLAVVVGPQLRFPDGRWQRSYGQFPSVWLALQSALFIDGIANLYRRHRTRRHPLRMRHHYVDGAFFAVNKNLFLSLGGFDERYGFYGEDADFSYRATRGGFELWHVPEASVAHLRGASSSRKRPSLYAEKYIGGLRKFVCTHHGIAAERITLSLLISAFGLRWLLYTGLQLLAGSTAFRHRAITAHARFMATIHAWRHRDPGCQSRPHVGRRNL